MRHPLIRELKELLGDLVAPIASGTKYNLHFRANVPTVEAIYSKLVSKYGTPSQDHPLIETIQWKVGTSTIILHKAYSYDADSIMHAISIV